MFHTIASLEAAVHSACKHAQLPFGTARKNSSSGCCIMHWGVDAFNGFLTFIEFQIEAFPVLQGRYWSHSREDRGVQQGAKQTTVSRFTSKMRQRWTHGNRYRSNSTVGLDSGGFSMSPWHKISTPKDSLEILLWFPKVWALGFSNQK